MVRCPTRWNFGTSNGRSNSFLSQDGRYILYSDHVKITYAVEKELSDCRKRIQELEMELWNI